MKPQILEEPEMADVQDALQRFYASVPDRYGIMDRDQETYDSYAAFIAQCSGADHHQVLDLGSGSWRIPEAIAQHEFDEVVGLDLFSEDKLKNYQARLSQKGVRLVTYDGLRIPFPDKSMDIVSSMCMFEHIVNARGLLDEIDRVLRVKGIVVILAPNWSGPNNPIRALQSMCSGHGRYWQYESLGDALFGLMRSVGWYVKVRLSSTPKFLTVKPRMKAGEIDFQRGDDDVVHLCQPMSFKKYFKMKGYTILRYNRQYGETAAARVFNTLFPSFATTNTIVVQKRRDR